MDIANASLLDESSSAAEAVQMSYNIHNGKRSKYFVSESIFPQTIDVIKTKAHAIGIELVFGKTEDFDWEGADEYSGMIVQNPDNFGSVKDFTELSAKLQENKLVFTIISDILSCTILKTPGEMGADITCGSAQRMGIPLGYGGPHPGFFASKDKYKRKLPGRVIGISKDVHGNQAFRMAMQTREQHIRRDKATSNICTAQALLANMAAFYMQWHGPKGLTKIAHKVRFMSQILMEELDRFGVVFATDQKNYFDTVTISVSESGFTSADYVISVFHKYGINLRKVDNDHVSISFDEISTLYDLDQIISIFASIKKHRFGKTTNYMPFEDYEARVYNRVPDDLKRTSLFLQ